MKQLELEFDNEEWVKVEGYGDQYYVSNKARVRKFKDGEWFYPSITIDKYGYKRLKLNYNGKKEHVFVHRLVAKAFVPNPNPNRYNIVNHIDENKLNNSPQNLEWCDIPYNLRYSRTRHQRAIVKCTLEGNYIRRFSIMKDAVDICDYQRVREACCGRNNHEFNGYLYYYEDELNGKQLEFDF